MLSFKEKLLANSRLAVINSSYGPMYMGCLIISAIYIVAGHGTMDFWFSMIWMLLAFMTWWKMNSQYKKVLGDIN